jgi:hypothetical protein
VKKPAARLKPVASAAVPPASTAAAAKTATKPVAQKPKTPKPPLEQMMDDLFKTLSNGQPPNPALQPASPGTRR